MFPPVLLCDRNLSSLRPRCVRRWKSVYPCSFLLLEASELPSFFFCWPPPTVSPLFLLFPLSDFPFPPETPQFHKRRDGLYFPQPIDERLFANSIPRPQYCILSPPVCASPVPSPLFPHLNPSPPSPFWFAQSAFFFLCFKTTHLPQNGKADSFSDSPSFNPSTECSDTAPSAFCNFPASPFPCC